MAVALTTKAPQYFLTPFDNGIQRPITSMELTSIFKKTNPKWIGSVIAEDYEMPDSLLAEVMARGNDFVFATDQVVWEEDETIYETASVTGAGAVSFALDEQGDVTSDGIFTINNAAIPADDEDFDSERPTVAKWLQVKPGMEFTVFDTNGKKANGKIISIATDLKTFQASPIGGTWGTLGASVEIYFGGNNLDHCEQAPCIAYEKYKPKRNNTMKKDSECVAYCWETEVANGSDGVDSMVIFKNPNGDGDYRIDQRLEDAQKKLLARAENDFAFSKRLTSTEAAGGPVGTNGVMTILEKRATKNQGKIENLTDIKNLAAQFRSKRIYKASLRVSNEQYSLLLDLYNVNSTLSFSPYEDKTSELYSIGLRGFRIGDVEITFQRWSALDEMGTNIGKRYHYLAIPDKKLRRKIGGAMKDCNYLNVGWFGNNTKVMKFNREDDHTEESKGNFKITYEVKFVPIVFRPQDFIMGITV